MRYYIIYSVLCAAFVIRGSEVTIKPVPKEPKVKRSVLTSKLQSINSYNDFNENENSLTNEKNPWYPNPNGDAKFKMVAPEFNDYKLSDESLGKIKRDYKLYPLAKQLYALREHPVSREVKNHDDQPMSPTSAILGFKAHLHHDVGDIGRSFVHRPTKKDRLSTSIDLENEEYKNSLQLPEYAEDNYENRLPVQFLETDPDKIDHEPIRRQYSYLNSYLNDDSYLDNKDQMEHYLAVNRKPLEFDKNLQRYLNSDHLDYLDKYSKAIDRLGRNSLVLDDVTNYNKNQVDSEPLGEIRTKSLAMAIEPLNGQLQQLVDSVQQINQQLREQDKREVKNKESRKKRQIFGKDKDNCDYYSNDEIVINRPLEQSVTCTCYRLDETTSGGISNYIPSAVASITQSTESIDSILGGIHTILPSTVISEDSTTICPPVGEVKVEEVMDGNGETNCSYRFLRTNAVKLLELLLPAAVIQNVTTEGIIVKIPTRRERFISLETENVNKNLRNIGKERRWGLKIKNQLRKADDNKRWSIRLNLPGIEQIKKSVKRKADEKKNDEKFFNSYWEMLDKEEEQELENYEDGNKEKRSVNKGKIIKKFDENQSKVIKIGRRLMTVEDKEVVVEVESEEEEKAPENKKIPMGLAVLTVNDVTIPDPFDLFKQSEIKEKMNNNKDKVKGKLGSIKIPGIHELAKIGKEKLKYTPSTNFPTVTVGDPMEMLKEMESNKNSKGDKGNDVKGKSFGSGSIFEHIAKFKIPGPFELAKAAKAKNKQKKENETATSKKPKRSVRYKRFGKKDPTDYLLDLTQKGDSDLGDFNLPSMPAVSNFIEDESSTELYLAYTLPDFNVNKDSDNFYLNSEQTTPMFFPSISMDMPTVSMSTVYPDSELAPETIKPHLKSSYILKHETVEKEQDSDLLKVTKRIPDHLITYPGVFETETSILLELDIGLMTGTSTNETTEKIITTTSTSFTTETTVESTTKNDTAEFIECMSATEFSSTELTLETNATSATEKQEKKLTEEISTTESETTTLENISTIIETTLMTEATTENKCEASKEELIKQREKLEKLIKVLVDKERKLDDEEDEARKLMRNWEDQREQCGFLWDLFFPRPHRPLRPMPPKPTKPISKPTTSTVETTIFTETSESTVSEAKEMLNTTSVSVSVSVSETVITEEEETFTSTYQQTTGTESEAQSSNYHTEFTSTSTSEESSNFSTTEELSTPMSESTTKVEFLSQSTTEFVSSETSQTTETTQTSETEFKNLTNTDSTSAIETESSSTSTSESTITETFLSSIITSESTAFVKELQNLTETIESTTELVSWSTLSWISNITESIWSSLSTELFTSSPITVNVTETTFSKEKITETDNIATIFEESTSETSTQSVFANSTSLETSLSTSETVKNTVSTSESKVSGSTITTIAEISSTFEETTSEMLTSSVSLIANSLEPNITESLSSSNSTVFSTITETFETENSTSESFYQSGYTSSKETPITVMSSTKIFNTGSSESSSLTKQSTFSTEVTSTIGNHTTLSEYITGESKTSSSSSQTASESSTNSIESTTVIVLTLPDLLSTIESTLSGNFSSTITKSSESINTGGSSSISEQINTKSSLISTIESSAETVNVTETTSQGKFFWFPQTDIITKIPKVKISESLIVETTESSEEQNEITIESSGEQTDNSVSISSKQSISEQTSEYKTKSSTIRPSNTFFWFPQTIIVTNVPMNPDSFTKSTLKSLVSEAVEPLTIETTELSEKTETVSGSSEVMTNLEKSSETGEFSKSVETSTAEMEGSEDILEEKLEELEKEVNEREKEVGELENLLENQEEEFEKKTEELEDLIKASTQKDKSTLSGEDLLDSSTQSGVIESDNHQYVYDPEEEVWREKLNIIDPEYNQTSMEYEDCTSTTFNSEAESTESPVAHKERKILAVINPTSQNKLKRYEFEDNPIKVTVPAFMLKENEWVNKNSDLPEPVIPKYFEGYTRIYQQRYKIPRKSFTPRRHVTKQSYQEMSKMIGDFENHKIVELEIGSTQSTASVDQKPINRRQKRDNDDDYYGDCDEDDYNNNNNNNNDNNNNYESEPIASQRGKKSCKYSSNINLKKAEIAMLENENDELIKKGQLLKQIQDALQISKHELRRVESSILGDGIQKRAKRNVGFNETLSDLTTYDTFNSSFGVYEALTTFETINSSKTLNLSSIEFSSTQATPSNNTESYMTRKSSYTVHVVHLVYDDDLEGHKVKLVNPDPQDFIVDQGLVTSDYATSSTSTTESITDTTEDLTSTLSTLCPPCGQTTSMPWPTEAPDKYHLGGTQSWHKEVPVPCMPIRVQKHKSDRRDGFIDNLRINLERQLEKSILLDKKNWTFQFGGNNSDERDLFKKTIEELDIPMTQASNEVSLDDLKRCLEASKSYRSGKISYKSTVNDSFSIWKLTGPKLKESKELMSPLEFYCIYKYGFPQNGDNMPQRHLLAINNGELKPKRWVSKQQSKRKFKKKFIGNKKRSRSQKSAKRSIFDNIKQAFNHMIGNDPTTSSPVRIVKQSFRPKSVFQTKAYKVPSRLYVRKQKGKNLKKHRILLRKSPGIQHQHKDKKPKHIYKKFWIKLDPQDVRSREVRQSDKIYTSEYTDADYKKIHVGLPTDLNRNKLGVTEKILIYVTKLKNSSDSSQSLKSKRHRKSAFSNLDFEDLYKDKNFNRLIYSFADKVIKYLEGSSRSLRELDPRLRVKVVKGSSVSRNFKDFGNSDSEFTIDLSDINADTDAKYFKRSNKNLAQRLVGKSDRKMKLNDNFGKKRQNWIREIKRNEIVRKLRQKLLSVLEKRIESDKINDPKKKVEFDSLSFDEPLSRIDKLGEKFKIMYAMHNSPREISTNFRRKRNDGGSLLEGVYFDNEKDKKLMKALIDQIFDVQRGVNTTLQIIKRRLTTPSDLVAISDRRLIKKKSPKKVKKKAPKMTNKKSVGHKNKLKSSYDEGHMDQLRNDIEQILKEDTRRKKRKLDGFKKRKILSVAYDYDDEDANTEEMDIKIRNVKIKDRQPEEVIKERSSKLNIKQSSSRKNLKRNNEAKVANCVDCICDMEATIESLKNIVTERKNLVDRIANLKCENFADVGEELELTASRIIEDIYPAQKTLLQVKNFKYIKLTDLDKVLEAGEGVGRDNEILSFPGMDLIIPCNRHPEFNWILTISRPNYTWTRQDEAPISGTIYKNGNLELSSLSIQDAGNYSCTLTYVDPDNEEIIKHVYKHCVQVVTLPRYSLRGGNRYRIANCDEEALDTLATYLPQKLNGILCKRHLCDTFIFAPQCNDHQVTIKVLITLSSLSTTVPFLSKCGLRCHKAIQDKLILLLSQNLSTILTKSIPCSPGFHSKDLSPQCQRCPVGSYQPNLGSRVCRLCTNPFIDGCYEMLWTSPITLGTFSLVIIIIILLIGLILCTTIPCIRKDKDRDKCLIINTNESRRPLISSRDRDYYGWKKNVNYKNGKSERPFVYGVDVIPRRKKNKIEAKKKQIFTCTDSDSIDCFECKKLNLQNRGSKKIFRPPVPYPDFDK